MQTFETMVLSPAFVAFIAFIVLGWGVYAGYKIQNKGQNVFAIFLFNLVLQFVVFPLTLILASYFASVTVGTAVLSFTESLLVSSAVMGFVYFVKLFKYFI